MVKFFGISESISVEQDRETKVYIQYNVKLKLPSVAWKERGSTNKFSTLAITSGPLFWKVNFSSVDCILTHPLNEKSQLFWTKRNF